MKAKNTLIGLGVIASIIILVKVFGEKEKKEGANNFSGKETDSKKTESTPPPMTFSNVQKWVYSVEDGKDYCRWYDRYGKNTRTYNSPCSKSQANMYDDKKVNN